MPENRTPSQEYRTAKRRYLRTATSGLSLLMCAFLLDRLLDPQQVQYLVCALAAAGTLTVLTALATSTHLDDLYARLPRTNARTTPRLETR